MDQLLTGGLNARIGEGMCLGDYRSIKKIGMFTDIHFGARNNSDLHNLDNLEYIDWFIGMCKKEKVDCIAFLGDFFENRNAINVRTMKHATEACRRLNAVGVPIIWIVGNHDLYHRANRTIFSTDMFSDLANFLVVSEPMKITKDIFAAPYLFKDEYPTLVKDINSYPYVMGHFEFRDFVVTGADRKMEHGPDADDFSKPKHIFSGHFHKRQANKNIIYIGNTFPTNFGDAGDKERGCCMFDVVKDDVWFHDWENAPLFFKTRLSRVLEGDCAFPPRSRVRCLLDMDIGYSDVQALREEMLTGLQLREFSVEEDLTARKELLSEGLELEGEIDLTSLDNTVRKLITEGVAPSPTIDPQTLIKLYEELS
jgi:DNA repair exonuclease SbcCD nuclease subunit